MKINVIVLILTVFLLPAASLAAKVKQQESIEALAQDDDSPANKCAGKSQCKDMSNCAEARFYLTECGVEKLDRDHDGIPCESLCQ